MSHQSGDLVQQFLQKAEKMTSAELEARVRSYQGRDENSLSETELAEIVACMRVHRRTTAGPPKAKAKTVPVSLKDLF